MPLPEFYARHMKRLAGTRDVIWKTRDTMPSLIQSVSLTSYYQMCRETGLQLPEPFHLHVLWEPHWDENNPEGRQLVRIRKMTVRADEKDEKKRMGERYRSGSDSTLF